MNGDRKLYDEIITNLTTGPLDPKVEVVVGVPALYLEYVRSKLPKEIGVAAQNCYKVKAGAFTGKFLI